MAARRDAVVKRLWTGLKTLIDKNKVTWVAGRGQLDGPSKIKVSQPGEDGTPGKGGDRVLNATDVIIATGSRVKSLPGLTPDGKRIVTSDDLLKMDTLPKDIVIVGAGAVGVEFASMFADVGVKVTLLEYLPGIVPLEDAEVSKLLERSFTKRGMTVMTNARFDAKSVTADEHGICLMVGPDGKEPAETARRDDAGRHRPRRQHRGHRARDDQGRDRPGRDQGQRQDADEGVPRLRDRRRHRRAVARPHGRARRDHRGPHDRRRRRRPRDGLHDAAPRDLLPAGDRVDRADRGAGDRARPKIKIGKVPFQAIAKAIIGGEYEGFAKVIADADTNDTLGVHIIGPHATDLIAEASLGFELEATPWEIGGATHAHPTLSEVLGEAAMAVDGRSLNF